MTKKYRLAKSLLEDGHVDAALVVLKASPEPYRIRQEKAYFPTEQDVLDAVKDLQHTHPQGADNDEITEHIIMAHKLVPDYDHMNLGLINRKAFNKVLRTLKDRGEIVRGRGNNPRWKLKKKPKVKGISFIKSDTDTYTVFVQGFEIGELVRDFEEVGLMRPFTKEYFWRWMGGGVWGAPVEIPASKKRFDLAGAKRWLKSEVKKRLPR